MEKKQETELEVWKSTLDGRYAIHVVRTAPHQGVLTISEGENELYRQTVGLMYDALFGPDVADVIDWKRIAIEFVDGRKPSSN